MEEPGKMIVLGLHWASPWFLLLLLALPPCAWLLGRPAPATALDFSSLKLIASLAAPPRRGPRHWLLLLRFGVLAVAVLALARPQLPLGSVPEEAKGIDIMISLDFSASMLAQDVVWEGNRVARVDALSRVTKKLLAGRPNDRFGLVGFADGAYLASPLTLDHQWVQDIIEDIPIRSGTAIGDGIFVAARYLQDQSDREKTMLVISDGDSNTGTPPAEAAKFAAEQGIRIHTIRIAFRPVSPDALQQDVLYQAANITGGRFFQATDGVTLQNVFNEIDNLEKKRVEQNRFMEYRELFAWFVAAAGILLLVEIILSQFVWRRLP